MFPAHCRLLIRWCGWFLPVWRYHICTECAILLYIQGTTHLWFPMSMYYDLMNAGGYFFTLLLFLFRIQNVITTQIGIRIPFIILSFLTAYVVYSTGKEMDFGGRYASRILLTSLIYFFTAIIYRSVIIVSEFFLITSSLFIPRRWMLLSSAIYGRSIGS